MATRPSLQIGDPDGAPPGDLPIVLQDPNVVVAGFPGRILVDKSALYESYEFTGFFMVVDPSSTQMGLDMSANWTHSRTLSRCSLHRHDIEKHA